jgi:hypothetical protein
MGGRARFPTGGQYSGIIPSLGDVTFARHQAPGRRTFTAQGHPRATFHRAIDRGNLLVTEMTAREIGRITLAEALKLTILIAQRGASRAGSVP